MIRAKMQSLLKGKRLMKMAEYQKTHMQIPWHDYSAGDTAKPARQAALSEKASIIGRVGTIMLSCGTTAWSTRNAMVQVAKALDVACVAEIGIITLNFTCFSEHESYTQAISLEGIGVNIDKLRKIEKYVSKFSTEYADAGIEENHRMLDLISNAPHLYRTQVLALAAAFACAAFTFNLGGGLAQIICVFIAAGCGNLMRVLSNKRKLSAMIGVTLAAVTSCLVYAGAALAAKHLYPEAVSFGAGFIGSVLFLVPGFPFITSVLDFGKLDMRSGIERLMYSLIVMAFATGFCWAAALAFGLDPAVGNGIPMSDGLRIVIRLAASFIGVVGFSLIFNSPWKIMRYAAVIGAFANTLRLELVDRTGISAIICAFIGAFVVGLLAGVITKKTKYPGVGITIPAVVVSVPGLFMYRAIYYLGTGQLSDGISSFAKAAAIVFAIGLGILFARYLTDSKFRYQD